tara:strand:- start:1188 stop:1763 length:576 start_codon:yes stop_codon:yes gene_type:complete
MNNQANILKVVSVFAMDNRVKVIRYLNMTGYAQLNANSSLKDINSAIADNMFDDQFWLNFVTFMYENSQDDLYSNWITMVVEIVGVITTSIHSMYLNAKQALFSRNMFYKQDERNKETEKFYKDLAELNAKKELAIQMNIAQQDLKLKREQQEDSGKTTQYLLMFGVFLVGALTLAYVIRKKNKSNKLNTI